MSKSKQKPEPTPDNDPNAWLSNPEAMAFVKQQLIRMGIPLESRVARICAEWSDQLNEWDFNFLISSRIIYGDTSAQTALREIDQVVSAQTSVDILNADQSDHISLVFELHIPIECKHRHDLAVFGFPTQSRHSGSATNPIICDFPFADFMKEIDKNKTFLGDESICTIGLLDNVQKSPRIADEQLVYKAGASLCDFILSRPLPVDQLTVDPIIEKMGLLERFHNDSDKFGLHKLSAVQFWMDLVFNEEVQQAFTDEYIGRYNSLNLGFDIYMPLICVDAPLYKVSMTDDGTIEDITPANYLLTSLRPPNWPGVLQNYLVRNTPEAIVTVVNVEHLSDFLDKAGAWFESISFQLLTLKWDTAIKTSLQKSFLQSLLSTKPATHHRNDLWRI